MVVYKIIPFLREMTKNGPAKISRSEFSQRGREEEVTIRASFGISVIIQHYMVDYERKSK